MRFNLQCCKCKATCWARASYDSSVNASDIDDSQELMWGKENDCEHDEYDIIDEEYDNED